MQEARGGLQKVEWGEFYQIENEIAVRMQFAAEISMGLRLPGGKNDDFLVFSESIEDDSRNICGPLGVARNDFQCIWSDLGRI